MQWLEVKQRVKKTLSIKVYPLLFLVLPNRQIKSVWIPRKFMRLVAAFMNMIIHLCTFIIITWVCEGSWLQFGTEGLLVCIIGYFLLSNL